MNELEAMAGRLGRLLERRGECLAVAESCTGGWVAQTLTAVAGSSAWFDRGFVTYSNAAKRDMLGVPETTLVRHGAVSEAVARAMAQGVLAHSLGDWSVSITGIAGPSGGSPEKPVGMGCFAWAGRQAGCVAATCQFAGDRAAVREQSVRHALAGLISLIEAQPVVA